MNFSTDTRYAIRLLFELRHPGPPVSTSHIAERIGIPSKTAEKIHAILKNASITGGTMGAKGGISLLIPLTQISLGQIIILFDDGVRFSVCQGNKANTCPHQDACGSSAAWDSLSAMVQESFNAISLWQILEKHPETGCFS